MRLFLAGGPATGAPAAPAAAQAPRDHGRDLEGAIEGLFKDAVAKVREGRVLHCVASTPMLHGRIKAAEAVCIMRSYQEGSSLLYCGGFGALEP